MDKSSSLGMPMAPLEHIQEVQIIKAWGCPRHPLVLHQSVSGQLSCTMFLFVHAISVILGASVVLVFSIDLFGFVCCSIWLHIITLDWERDTLRFHCREHSSFHSIH